MARYDDSLKTDAFETQTAQSKKTKSNSRKRRRRRRRNPFLGFLILLAIIAAAVFFMKSDVFTVSEINIEGNKYHTPSQIREITGIETGMNIFFDVKAGAAKKSLLESPYIKMATVDRKLPTTINIVIEERRDFAAIYYGNVYFVIDDEGSVLRTSETDPELPIIEGVEVSEPEIGKPLNATQSYLLNGTLELLKKTEKNDLYFKKVYFSSAVVKAYIYDDYYCEGAPESLLEKLEDIKVLVSDHYTNGINKGVIKVVSGDSPLFFDSKID